MRTYGAGKRTAHHPVPGSPALTPAQLAALTEIAHAALTEVPLLLILSDAAASCAGVLGYRAHAVLDWSAESGLRVLSSSGIDATAHFDATPSGLNERAVYESRSLFPDGMPGRMALDLAALLKRERLVDGVTVVLPGAGSVVAIGLYDRSPRDPGERGRMFVAQVQHLLAEITEHRRLETVMRTEINERTALAEIAQAVTSSTDIVDVFGLVAEQARQLLPFDYIAMWDRLQGASGFRVMAAVGAPSPSWGQSAVQPERSVPLTQILGTGGAVVTVMDPTDVLGHYDSGLGIEGMQTTLHIPLMWRGDLIGVLVIASKHASAFSPSQVRIADRLGSQVNGAFANAHLLRRVERNAQENATVAAVSSLLDSSKSLAEAYEHVANVLRSVVRFDYISFLLSDVAHGTVELLFSSGVPGARWVPRQSFPLAGSVTESVMKLNSGMLFYGDRIERTTHQHPGFELTSQPGDVTTLALPLRAKNEPLGAVLVQVHGQVAYSQEDVALLRRVADQVAEAIMRRQLYLRAEREAMQQTALAELGASLTAAQDLASVLDIVTRGVTGLIRANRVVVDLVEEDRPVLSRVLDSGSVQMPGFEYELRASNTLKDLADVLGPSRTYPFPGEAGQMPHLQSRMQAPLKSRGNLIGRIVVWSEDKNAYAQQELGLLQQASAQIAPAIENVRHYATLERAVRDRQLLAEIGRVMGSSLDIDDVYTEFASLVRMLIPFDRIAISRINARNGTVVDSYQEGVLLPDRPLHLVRPLAGTPAEDLLRMGKSMMLDLRVDDSPIIGYTQKKVRMTGAGLWSCISVLLTTRNNVVATMDLSSRRKGAYSLRDLEIAERIAAQVAGAIANSSAYEQIARDRRTTMDGRFAVQRPAYITEAAATNPAGASAPEQPVSVVLLGGEKLSRHGLVALLRFSRIRVAGECESNSAGLDLVRTMCPDVVLLYAASEDCTRFVAEVRDVHLDARLIVLSSSFTSDTIADLVRAGATGFLEPGISADKLVNAITEVASGGTVVDPRLMNDIITSLALSQNRLSSEDEERLATLDETDRRVLVAVAHGKTTEEIALELKFAAGTIKNRLGRVYRRIGVSDRAQAASFAARCGLV